MTIPAGITFVIAVSSRELLGNNFLASPCLTGQHEILVQENFDSASKAYNDALDRAANDLIIFCHQDIVFPKDWLSQLDRALEYLDRHDPRWGVLGVSGTTQDGRCCGPVYSSGLDVIGEVLERPTRVQTLDEIVLILRKSSGLRFDDSLPHFHFYGTDICLRAAHKGMNSYAISAFCIHNTLQTLVLPREFYECRRHIKRVWNSYLPIQTTCIRITKFNVPLYNRRLREVYLRYFRRKKYGAVRIQNPLSLLQEFAGKY